MWKALEALSARPSRVLLTCHCPRITSLFNPWVSDPGVASSLFVSTRLGRNHESTLVMHVDETKRWNDLRWTTPAPTMNIFGPLLPRFQNVTRAFLSRIMMFFNPCRESVFHRFRFRFKCLGQILGRGGDYFATTTFNVCGFIIYF